MTGGSDNSTVTVEPVDLLPLIDEALSSLVVLRSTLGAVAAPPLSDEALDAALRASAGRVAARARVRGTQEELRTTVDAETWRLVLDLETHYGALEAEAIDVVWTLGWTAGTAIRGPRTP